MTSIEAFGRRLASVFDSSSSDLAALPMISAVVITLRALQASAITEAASALVPALATISIRSLVRPARSESQAFMEERSPLLGAPSTFGAVKKVARCQVPWARRLTTASLGGSSATTFTARGEEFG